MLVIFSMALFWKMSLISRPKKILNNSVIGNNKQGLPTSKILYSPQSSEKTANRIAYYPQGATGYAISYPQCGKNYPNPPYDFGILGITKGHSLSQNPCLKSELDWAGRATYEPSYYVNLDFPSYISKNLIKSFNCQQADQKCVAYHYGGYIVKYAHSYAVSQGAAPGNWWLDVQIISNWSKTKTINAQVALGAIDYFKAQGLPVGLSTTPYQWNEVVGNLNTGLPTWIPGRANKQVAAQYCLSGKSYSNGRVRQLAYIESNFEAVYACSN